MEFIIVSYIVRNVYSYQTQRENLVGIRPIERPIDR